MTAKLPAARALVPALAAVLVLSGAAGPDLLEVRINGRTYSLHKESIRYYYPQSDGKIQQGLLARAAAAKIRGTLFRFAAGKEICFHQNGTIAWGFLDRPVRAAAGGATILLAKAAADWEMTRFHQNGALEEACPAADTALKAGDRRWLFKKPSAEHETLHFHKNGSVERGCLAKRTLARISGKKVNIAGIVLFYDNGAVEAAHLAEPETFLVGKNLVKFQNGEYWQVELFKNGNIERGYLFETVSLDVGGMNVKLQFNALFDGRGRVIEGMPAEDFQWKGGVFRASQVVRIEYDGNAVKSIVRRVSSAR